MAWIRMLLPKDYPAILTAVLGGFLQQMFGPQKLLLAAAAPALLSWLTVLVWPDQLAALLASRVLAGVSNGLLSVNVYMADVAPSKG